MPGKERPAEGDQGRCREAVEVRAACSCQFLRRRRHSVGPQGLTRTVSPHPPTDQHRFAPTPSTTPRLPRSDVSAKDMVDIATGQIHVARMLSLEFITSKWCSLFYSAPGRSSP
jgi:hypothetical protein